jgi:hypothetical protein
MLGRTSVDILIMLWNVWLEHSITVIFLRNFCLLLPLLKTVLEPRLLNVLERIS